MRISSLFKHFAIFVLLISNGQSVATSKKFSGSRAPASYILNDDLIVTPVEAEKNFFTELNSRYASSFDRHRRIVENWQRNEELESLYGLEGRGIFKTSTVHQRQKFLQRNYLRFVTKQVENNANDGIVNWWNRWNDDDEIESIENVSLHEKKITATKKQIGLPGMNKSKVVNKGKDNIKFGFRPYIELGMMRLTMDTDYFKARGWFGVNGNQEINIQQFVKTTKTKFIYNYYLDQQRSLAVVDQRITEKVSLRYTHNKTFEDFGSITRSGFSENNIFQVRFGMGF